jgi:preprotein translocase subunit SecE
MEGKRWMEKIAQWPRTTKNYIDDLQTEMRRVTWPSWKQVRATTAVVVIAVFAFSAYFFVVDQLISRAVDKIFQFFVSR